MKFIRDLNHFNPSYLHTVLKLQMTVRATTISACSPSFPSIETSSTDCQWENQPWNRQLSAFSTKVASIQNKAKFPFTNILLYWLLSGEQLTSPSVTLIIFVKGAEYVYLWLIIISLK